MTIGDLDLRVEKLRVTFFDTQILCSYLSRKCPHICFIGGRTQIHPNTLGYDLSVWVSFWSIFHWIPTPDDSLQKHIYSFQNVYVFSTHSFEYVFNQFPLNPHWGRFGLNCIAKTYTFYKHFRVARNGAPLPRPPAHAISQSCRISRADLFLYSNLPASLKCHLIR